MYAQLYQLTIESNKLPVMFTVITSPDTPLASYWGHMSETFTTRSGIAFKRPLLTAEHPAGQSTMANNESWLSLNTAAKNDVSKSDCGEPYQPLLSEFQELYSEHPNGAIGTDLGLPLTNTGGLTIKLPTRTSGTISLLIYRMDQACGIIKHRGICVLSGKPSCSGSFYKDDLHGTGCGENGQQRWSP